MIRECGRKIICPNIRKRKIVSSGKDLWLSLAFESNGRTYKQVDSNEFSFVIFFVFFLSSLTWLSNNFFFQACAFNSFGLILLFYFYFVFRTFNIVIHLRICDDEWRYSKHFYDIPFRGGPSACFIFRWTFYLILVFFCQVFTALKCVTLLLWLYIYGKEKKLRRFLLYSLHEICRAVIKLYIIG